MWLFVFRIQQTQAVLERWTFDIDTDQQALASGVAPSEKSQKEIQNEIVAEFSIYNEKFRDTVIKEHQRKFVLPIYITVLLYILKFFY